MRPLSSACRWCLWPWSHGRFFCEWLSGRHLVSPPFHVRTPVPWPWAPPLWPRVACVTSWDILSPDAATLRLGLQHRSFEGTQFSSGLPWWLSSKESACRCSRRGFDPWVGKIRWRRKWHPTPVFLSGESHGQRSLESYSLWGCKEPDRTEWLNKNRIGSFLAELIHWNWAFWFFRAG